MPTASTLPTGSTIPTDFNKSHGSIGSPFYTAGLTITTGESVIAPLNTSFIAGISVSLVSIIIVATTVIIIITICLTRTYRRKKQASRDQNPVDLSQSLLQPRKFPCNILILEL